LSQSKIDDIIQTKEDEIKFLVSDVSEKWNTYNYEFPVPLKGNEYPYTFIRKNILKIECLIQNKDIFIFNVWKIACYINSV